MSNTTKSFDLIVVGVGAMGASTCYHLAKRGVRVLGLERFDIPHGMGSYHGHSRMIRLAYFEHPDYVPLLRRSYALWDELAAELGRGVIHITGGLMMGPPGAIVLEGSLRSVREHGLPHELLDAAEAMRRFPQFNIPEDYRVLHDHMAGLVLPERAVAGYAELAMRHGAVLHGREPVVSWSAGGNETTTHDAGFGGQPRGADDANKIGNTSDNGEIDRASVTVRTETATYTAAKLIFCGGAWTDRLIADLGVPLTITRQPMAWVWPKQPDLFPLGKMPVWIMEHRDGTNHYGFPMLPDQPGVKLATHDRTEPADAETLDRNSRPTDEAAVRWFLRDHMPAADGPLLSMRICMYTNTPDHDFIIDRHPRHPNVTIACGFSGHGFKCASAIGEALAEIATIGRTTLAMDFLSLKRFAAASQATGKTVGGNSTTPCNR